MKFLSIVAVAVLLLTGNAADGAAVHMPPKMRLPRANGQDISVQRCRDANCTTGCRTVVEFKGDECHTSGVVFKHGEQLHCAKAPQRNCFRETLFNAAGGVGCNGNVIVSAPRECGVCTEDPFGKFFKYTGCGTSQMAVSRGCDFGCYNCEVEIPIQENTCVQHKGLVDLALFVSEPKSCAADIRADHFRSPLCDGLPEFEHTVFTNECYSFFGVGHKFVCS